MATQKEQSAAWKRITAAAKRYDIEVEARDWRDVMRAGKARRRS